MCQRFVTIRMVCFVAEAMLDLSNWRNTVKGQEILAKRFRQAYQILLLKILSHLTLLFSWSSQKYKIFMTLHFLKRLRLA